VRASGALGVFPLVLSATSLLGYAYGVRELHALLIINTMAVHLTTCIFLLSLATSLMQAQNGWLKPLISDQASATSSRRLFMFALAPPTMAGLLICD